MNEKTDDTPLWSRRQLIQSAGQFLIAFAVSFAGLPADQPLSQRLLMAAMQGLVAAGAILGFSFLPAPKK